MLFDKMSILPNTWLHFEKFIFSNYTDYDMQEIFVVTPHMRGPLNTGLWTISPLAQYLYLITIL